MARRHTPTKRDRKVCVTRIIGKLCTLLQPVLKNRGKSSVPAAPRHARCGRKAAIVRNRRSCGDVFSSVGAAPGHGAPRVPRYPGVLPQLVGKNGASPVAFWTRKCDNSCQVSRASGGGGGSCDSPGLRGESYYDQTEQSFAGRDVCRGGPGAGGNAPGSGSDGHYRGRRGRHHEIE